MATILFGGSFDPIHNGHLAMVQAAKDCLPKASVLLLPAACSPFKTHRSAARPDHRLAMCRLAVQGEERTQVSDLEFHLPTPSYTVKTVRYLQNLAADSYYFLCGADSYLSLPLWHEYADLLKRVTFLVAHRLGSEEEQLSQQQAWVEQNGGQTIFLPMKQLPVSSSQVRQCLLEGKSIETLVPPAVLRYIQENHLYQE